MKFSAVFFVACAAALVSAETNAARMARGLAPNAPVRRGTPVDSEHTTFHSLLFSLLMPLLPAAKRGKTSPGGGGSSCSNGDVYCCSDVGQYGSHKNVNEQVQGLGLQNYVPVGTSCGLNCSPISVIGAGSGASWYTDFPMCLRLSLTRRLAPSRPCAAKTTSSMASSTSAATTVSAMAYDSLDAH